MKKFKELIHFIINNVFNWSVIWVCKQSQWDIGRDNLKGKPLYHIYHLCDD